MYVFNQVLYSMKLVGFPWSRLEDLPQCRLAIGTPWRCFSLHCHLGPRGDFGLQVIQVSLWVFMLQGWNQFTACSHLSLPRLPVLSLLKHKNGFLGPHWAELLWDVCFPELWESLTMLVLKWCLLWLPCKSWLTRKCPTLSIPSVPVSRAVQWLL